jgi:hypothetical protein
MEETGEQEAAAGNWMGNLIWGRRPAGQGNQRPEGEDEEGEPGETREEDHGDAH